MHTHIHTPPCTNSTLLHSRSAGMVPCAQTQPLREQRTHACTHTHAHACHCSSPAPGTRQPLTLPLRAWLPLLFPLPGSAPADTCLAPPSPPDSVSPRPSLAALQWTLLCPTRPLAFSVGATKMRWRRSPGNTIPPPPHVRERATHHTQGHRADERLSCAWSPGFPATGPRVTLQLQAQRLLPLPESQFSCCELGG